MVALEIIIVFLYVIIKRYYKIKEERHNKYIERQLKNIDKIKDRYR